MIQIDGSYLEGGGQILRTSLGLSAITGKAFEIKNVRKNRSRPGLMPQHLNCVRSVAEICNGSVEGDEPGSTELKFYPRQIKSKNLEIDVGTAGSVNLVLQSLLIPVFFGGKKFKITVKGGTDVPFSPTSSYFLKVLLPYLKKFAHKSEYEVKKRGFFPKGGGRVEFFVRPKFLLDDFSSFSDFLDQLRKSSGFGFSERKKIFRIEGLSLASSELGSAKVAERQADSAKINLKNFGVPVNVEAAYVDSGSQGSSITLWATLGNGDVYETDATIVGSSAIGRKGKPAEEIGKQAALELNDQMTVMPSADKHLSDQLVPFMALAGGRIETTEITSHCLSNVKVAEEFLEVKFKTIKNELIAIT